MTDLRKLSTADMPRFFKDRGFRSAAAGAITTAFVAGWSLSVDMTEAAPILGLLLVPTNTYTGPSPTPNASFGIARFDRVADTQLVAPVALWFTPTSITGFVGFDGESISEPSGTDNVYDPTANEIFWSWDFGETGYVPLVTPNTPLTHRDTNRAFVKRPCHVFWKPQPTTTVTLYGYDTAGNWGTRPYTFNDTTGDSPAIQDPDDYFAGADTIFFSKAGIYPDPADIPDGALTTTSESSVNSRISSRVGENGTKLVRVRLRRGETYTDIALIGNSRPCYIDSYGDPLADPPKQARITGGSGPFDTGSNQGIGENQIRIIDQDWEGPYDAATETGRRVSPIFSGPQRQPNVLYHRFRMSGANAIYLTVPTVGATYERVFSDSEVTNWQDYGIYANDSTHVRFAIIGGDLHQKSDALTGTTHGGVNSDFANLTNRHGPIRINRVYDLYVGCSSFFSRNGWSNFSNRLGTAIPSTVCQNAWRWGGITYPTRSYAAFDRSSFESGASQIGMTNPDVLESPTFLANVLIESCLFVPAAGQWGDATRGVIGGVVGRGLCVRNNYFFIPDVNFVHGNQFTNLIRATWNGPTDPLLPSVVAVFNNTVWIAGTPPGGDMARTIIDASGHTTVYEENNIYYAPNLPGPTHGPYGLAFAPLGTSPLAGFTPRYLGVRWNFPPIGHPYGPTMPTTRTYNPGDLLGEYIYCEDLLEGGDGVAGWGPGQWLRVPYPDYTGFCRGSNPDGPLGQVTQAIMAANSGTHHQISVFEQTIARADGSGILFEFPVGESYFRIQNTSASTTWTGPIWILLDLRDHLMDFRADTANPASIPAPVPGTGSAAILVTESGLFAQRDFFGSVRQGKTAGGQVAVTGKAIMQGAFVEAPA